MLMALTDASELGVGPVAPVPPNPVGPVAPVSPNPVGPVGHLIFVNNYLFKELMCYILCSYSSVVEHQFAELMVSGSNPLGNFDSMVITPDFDSGDLCSIHNRI